LICRGDKYRLTHIRETLENGKELYISDKDFLQNLIKTHLKDRIYQARVVSTPEPEQSLIIEPSTKLESAAGGFTFTNDGEIGESSTKETAQIKSKSKRNHTPKPKKKSKQQELEEYEKKYLNESETRLDEQTKTIKIVTEKSKSDKRVERGSKFTVEDMFCTNCGSKFTVADMFCTNCGVKQ